MSAVSGVDGECTSGCMSDVLGLSSGGACGFSSPEVAQTSMPSKPSSSEAGFSSGAVAGSLSEIISSVDISSLCSSMACYMTCARSILSDTDSLVSSSAAVMVLPLQPAIVTD